MQGGLKAGRGLSLKAPSEGPGDRGRTPPAPVLGVGGAVSQQRQLAAALTVLPLSSLLPSPRADLPGTS